MIIIEEVSFMILLKLSQAMTNKLIKTKAIVNDEIRFEAKL